MDKVVEVSNNRIGDRILRGKRLKSPFIAALQDNEESSQKIKRLHHSSIDTHMTAEQSQETNGSETHMIFSQYEVVRTILNNLPLQDLRTAAQVCSCWKSVAKIILQSRTKIEWFLVSQLASLEEILKTKLYSDPKLCILFTTRKKKKIFQCMRSHMGPACVTLEVQGSGIVGANVSSFESDEIEGNRKLSISALLIPAIPGVTCRTFKLSPFKMKQFKRKGDLTPEELLKLTSIDPAEEVKCLLLFCGGFSEHMRQLVLSIKNRQSERLVLGGAVCYEHRDMIFGVALSGCNVVAASMLLPNNITSVSKAETYFEKFRKDTNCIEAKQTVCFMFACVGRGKMMYGEPNIESSLFRKYFPSTPLVGFFGFGEIGYDSVPTDGNTVPNSSDEDFDMYYIHDFSSVFVYVGIF